MAGDPLTTALDEIRKREQEATRGPWKVTREHGYDIDGDRWDLPSVTGPGGEDIFVADVDQPAADLRFAAHAREDVPRLLAAVEAVLTLHSCVAWYAAADGCEHPEPEDEDSGEHDDWNDDHPMGTTGIQICLKEKAGSYCPECTRLAYGDAEPECEDFVSAPCPTHKAVLAALTGKEVPGA